MEVDACWVIASTEGSMTDSKTAGDACTYTVLSLEDSGVIGLISSSDVFSSAVVEAGRVLVCPTPIAMDVDTWWVLTSTEGSMTESRTA
eukprot:7975124-Ditylum_brightwellii.AAC.1